MGLPKPFQIPLESGLPLPLLDLPLHHARVRAELEALAVSKPEVVVGVAFEQPNALGFQGGVEVVECFLEELGEEQEGRPLVEAVALVVDQAASSSGEVILLQDRHRKPSFGKPCCCRYAAHSGAYRELSASTREGGNGGVACRQQWQSVSDLSVPWRE